jgi:selenide,water dikinase
MAERSGVALAFDAAALPVYDGALASAEAGTRTGGDTRNRSHLAGHVRSSVSPAVEALAYDPQTSGGLLAAVSSTDAGRLVEAGFVAIGEVEEGPPSVSLRG